MIFLSNSIFCVFDDNLLWLGSFNFTENASRYNNNNVLLIKNKEIINIAKKEFDEMHRGIFNGGAKSPEQKGAIKLYFCPEDDCASKYNKILSNAVKEIKCMFFDFTLPDVGDNIINLHKKGVDVKIIMESRQIGKYSFYDKFKKEGILVIKDKNPKTMHNKFCVIDNRYLITGSMNPSKHSQYKNDESIILIEDFNVANQYKQYFDKYWSVWNG